MVILLYVGRVRVLCFNYSSMQIANNTHHVRADEPMLPALSWHSSAETKALKKMYISFCYTCIMYTLKKIYVGGLYIISIFSFSFQQIDGEEMREDTWKVQW